MERTSPAATGSPGWLNGRLPSAARSTRGPAAEGGFEVVARLPIAAVRGWRMIRVLLADDQALVRAGFRMLLESADDITIVGRGGAMGAARWPWPVIFAPMSS